MLTHRQTTSYRQGDGAASAAATGHTVGGHAGFSWVPGVLGRPRPRDVPDLMARPQRGGHIITGKGKGSPVRPVLQPRVRRLLSEDYDERIDWFEQDDSGGGFLVKLK